MTQSFDSRPDTYDHIGKVQKNLNECILSLLFRAEGHDASKLGPPEREMYDEFHPKLTAVEYGSDEYHQLTDAMGPALAHHYEHNGHHPEHYEDGVAGMSLLDVIEMLCDWHAAAQRKGNHVRDGLEYGIEKHGISPQLASILRNTVEELWPVDPGEARR